MDNKKFEVNGRGEEFLLKTLELAFQQKGQTAAGWFVSQKHGLVLVWHTGESDAKYNKFPIDRATAEQVFPMVWAWLKSDDAKKIEMVGSDANADHDGSNSMGWRVFCEGWGHVANDHRAIVAIKPAYMWHGK